MAMVLVFRTRDTHFFALLLVMVILSAVIGGQFIEPCGYSCSLSLLFFYVYYAVLFHCAKIN